MADLARGEGAKKNLILSNARLIKTKWLTYP